MDLWTPGGSRSITSQGNKVVLAFIDAYSKYAVAYPLPNHTAATVTNVITRWLIPTYGPPQKLVSDNAQEFKGALQEELLKGYGVTRKLIPAHSPKSNGQIERFFRPLKDMLATSAASDPKNWDQVLSLVVFAYNTSVHSTIQNTPFYLMFGRDPQLDLSDIAPENELLLPTWEERHQEWTKARNAVARHLVKKQQDQINQEPTNPPYNFKVGDVVLVKKPPPTNPGAPRKLMPKWAGPLRVTECLNKTVTAEWMAKPHLPPVEIHKDRLRPCHGNVILDYTHYVNSGMPAGGTVDRTLLIDPDEEDDFELPPSTSQLVSLV
jgi:hypothetical protein